MFPSPTSPNLAGPSLDRFFCFSDADETQEASSLQELTLKDRIKSVIGQVGYKLYSSFNRPLIRPKEFAEVLYQVKKKKFFAKKPQSYEEARKKVLNDPLNLAS